jgi:uncharacterized YigZ family protein
MWPEARARTQEILRAHPVQYLTVAAPATAELEVERSVFDCLLAPAHSEAEARARISQCRTEHPRARHHCSAFVLGERGELRRSSDDQEPSGTAGAPMLQALTEAGLTGTVAVVSRQFGGRLLGAGRLTRTYREAVARAIENAETTLRRLHVLLRFRCNLAESGPAEGMAARNGWRVVGREWAAQVTYTCAVPPEQVSRALGLVAELTSGRAEATVAGHRFLPSAGG